MTQLDLASLGWDASRVAEWRPYASADDLEPARMARVDRSSYEVLTLGGLLRVTPGGELLARAAADPIATPCTGDWVVIRHWPDERITAEEVLERRTAIVRATASGRSEGQVLAANVDRVLVLVSLAVDPDLGRLERLLALAWESGTLPVVVLTKTDLVEDADLIRAEVTDAAPGVPIVPVSAVTRDGLDELAPHIGSGRTAVLLGQSGVGKSTLVNALMGATVLATREVRSDGKGRHTTAARELLLLPSGGVLIDTPGLRGVGLWSADDGVDRVFSDVVALADRCRFRDCRHESEPECAVLAAVASGQLPERRLESWRKLQREAHWIARRSDARLRTEQARAWKSVTRSLRRHQLNRP
jgi:ribosome biogenesis GTPase / thiamine phosphate phosphatase